MQFVRAHCASHDAASATGAVRLRHVLDALRFVLLVLPVACDARKRPHYDFLVYNASVTYWRIARQLMKRATWQFLVPSLAKLIDALRAVGERDVLWVAKLQLALVSAHLDAKQFAEAAKTVNDLVDVQLAPLLASATSDPAANQHIRELYDAALRAQVHVGSMKDAECQKIVPNVKKSAVVATNKRASLLVKLQCIKSGNCATALDVAYTELLQEATGFASFSHATTADELAQFLHSLDVKSVNAIDADVVADTGIHAAFSGHLSIAQCCDAVLTRKGKALAPRLRVSHQMLKAVVQVSSPLSAHNYREDTATRQRLALAHRVEAMKATERALLAAKRQEDAELLESVCIYAWNLSLPLLQPHLRTSLTRVFTLAANALEATDSMLLVLRARLLLEIAKLEGASEFLSKAYESVTKALALDYGAAITHAATLDDVLLHERKVTTRPVDLHLIELKKTLERRLDMYHAEDAEAPEGRIRALVAQARETKDSSSLQTALTQATATLTACVGACVPPEYLVPLWVDTCKLLRDKLQDASLAENFAKRGLETFFPGTAGAASGAYDHSPESPLRIEKSLMVLEIELRMLLVDVLTARIKRQSEQLNAAKSHVDVVRHKSRAQTRQQRLESSDVELTALKLLSSETLILGMHHAQTTELTATSTENAEAVLECVKRIDDNALAMKKELIEHLAASLAAAGRIGWRFTLENTCVFLWNYHFHLFRMLVSSATSQAFSVQRILPECVAAFEAAHTALEALPGVDMELLASTALGLAIVYEKQARWDRVVALADAFLKRKASSSALATTTSSSVNAVHLVRFAELKTRAQLAQNAKEISPGESASAFLRVAALLEALEASFIQPQAGVQSHEKILALFQKAVALWQSAGSDMVAPLLHAGGDVGANHEVLTMEQVQQHVEIFVELWTRVAYAALRMQQFRFVVECTTQALGVLLTAPGAGDRSKSVASAAVRPPLSTSAWRWLAASEVLCARAILALGNGEKTPKLLVLTALKHLVHGAECGDRAKTASMVLKASEVVWNAALMVLHSMNLPETSEYAPADVAHVIAALRSTLRYLSLACEALAPSDASHAMTHRCYGDLVLLALAVCEKADAWTESSGICDDALASRAAGAVPAEALNEIRTASAIALAKLGKPSGGSGAGGRKTDEQSPLLKAKILKKIAFSSVNDPPAQLKMLASAYTELDGRPEEQAVLLMDMAEWFYTSRIAPHEMDTYLDSATKILVAADTIGAARARSSAKPQASASTPALKHDADALTYSPLWLNEKLLRLFVMRAMAATTCADRWSFTERALHCVQRAWASVIAIANTATLQDAFAKLAGSAELDFDDWQRAQPRPYSVPQSSDEWLALYLQYAVSPEARFYMEWTAKLESVQSATVLHITDSVATGFYLEKLLAFLQDDALYELSLPVICLYQVVYYTYAPTRARAMELWLELTLFQTLEQLNVAACALPMQRALELFQAHGQTIIDELHASASNEPNAVVNRASVCRPVLASTSMRLLDKMQSAVALFLHFGYVRQAKTGLEILKRLAAHSSDDAMQHDLQMLTASVLAIEGSASTAAVEIEQALANPRALDLRKLVQWTDQFCDVSRDHDASLKHLASAERVLAHWLLSSSSSSVRAVNELDVLLWLAQLKSKRAVVLLTAATHDSNSKSVSREALSYQAFSECEQILKHVSASGKLSQCLLQYAQTLLTQTIRDAKLSTSTVVKRSLERAVAAMTDMRAQARQLFASSASRTSESPAAAHVVTPLETKIALAKTLLARLELDAEASSAAIREHEMTWYEYDSNARRTIVEKWLCATSSEVASAPGGDLGRAIVLASAAHALLSSGDSGRAEDAAMAAIEVLQCQRLTLFHNKDRRSAKRIHDRLWTRFTSAESLHATWVCCANSSSSTAPVAISSDASVPVDSVLSDDDARAAAAKDEAATERVDAFLSDAARQIQLTLKLALEKRYTRLLRVCALELIQVHGCAHPLECIRGVLLFQSVAAREHLETIFAQCVASRDAQQLHYRRMQLLQTSHAHAAKHSLPHQLSQLFLEQQSAAFKRMSIAVSVETVLASLPPHVRVLALQLSPDKCFLYCALVGSGDKQQFAMARMECTDATQRLLSDIRERTLRWRAASAALLTELEDVHSQDPDFEFTSVDSLAAQSLEAASDELEREFSALVRDTAELLAPLLSHSALLSALQSEVPGAALTLLLDRDLADLPLEALPTFERAESIARDFSIHVLYQRLQTQKAQPLKRDDVRYIADPYHEDAGLEAQTIEAVLQQHVKRPGAAFANWKDAVEHGQPPTRTDWQHALLNRRGGGLVYVGANRVLGSSLAMSDLLSMSTALNCHVVCLLDRAENTASARRQSKVDSEKTARELALESDAFANAALWSLAGVNVVVLNQYATTFNANRRLANGLLSGLAKGFSLGKALKKYGELVLPSGAVATAPPSTTNSAASSAASLPPMSNSNSTTALLAPADADSAVSSSGAKIRTASSRLLHDASSGGGVAAVAVAAAAGARSNKQRLKHRVRFNTVIYGLAHTSLKNAE